MPRRRNKFGRFMDEGKKSGTKGYCRLYRLKHPDKEKVKQRRYRLKNREKIKQRRNKYYGKEIPPRQRCNICNCYLDKFDNCNNPHNKNRCTCGRFLNKGGKCTSNHFRKDIFKGICKNCGREYTGRGQEFCSNLCNGNFMSGKIHPNWRGGISFEPYGLEFNNELKEQIRARDNHTCQECGYTQDQLKYKLHIHHIDYNKTNNHLDNLISLCNSCHVQTNFKRENWINYYKKKVIESASS